MATISLTEYAASGVFEDRTAKRWLVYGTRVEGDVVKLPFRKIRCALAQYNEAPAVDSQLFVNTATAGQVTFTDAGGGKALSFLVIGD